MTDRISTLAAAIACVCLAVSPSFASGGEGENDAATGAGTSAKVHVGAPKPAQGAGSVMAVGVDGPSAILDPTVIFHQLVARYRGLQTYRDTARIVHITHREGSEPSRLETEIDCEIRDGELKVTTPATQARGLLGLDLPVRKSQAAQALDRGYDLWLAPHMTLKFTDDPLKDFRSGIDEGFTPIDAERIVLDNRDMLVVELRSGDGLSESCTARFDLFINPETMLVERIDGEQQLPDGARCTTTMQITPHVYEFDMEALPATQR